MGFLDGVDEINLKVERKSDNKIFYRKMYYQCVDFIENKKSPFCCLTGPRKIGKTTVLKQLRENYPNSIYIEYKTNSYEKEYEMALNAISANENVIILMDEISHFVSYDMFILSIADKYTDLSWKENINYKIIFTGSESLNIQYLCRKGFASDCIYIKGSYLDFEEWLLKVGYISYYGEDYKPALKDYKDYVLASYSFATINDYEDYLRSCIDETIKSNLNSFSSLSLVAGDIDNEMELDNIIAISYASLISLHNGMKKSGYNNYEDMLRSMYISHKSTFTSSSYSTESFSDAVKKSVALKLQKLNKVSLFDFKKYLRYLMKIDFIICVEKTTDLTYSDLSKWLDGRCEIDNINSISDFLGKFHVLFNHPLFFISIGNSILKELGVYDVSEWYSGPLLGSIYECNLRGVIAHKWSLSHQLEYHDSNDNEVDLVEPTLKLLIEMSISDKKQKDIHFDCIPNYESYEKVVTSRTRNDYPYRIYSEYLLEVSRGYFVKSN